MEHEETALENDLQRTVNSLTTAFEHLGMEESIFDKFAKEIEEASTVNQIVSVISKLAVKLEKVIVGTKNPAYEQGNDLGQSNYNELEKLLQKYEAEIRDHIRIEQQLKIYSESLEERVTELESQLSLKKEIKPVREDSTRDRTTKNDKLKAKIKEHNNIAQSQVSDAVK